MHLRTHIAKRLSQRFSRNEAELILDYGVKSMPMLRKVIGRGDVTVLTVGDHVITISNCTSRNR